MTIKKNSKINFYKKNGIVTAKKFAIPSQLWKDSNFPFRDDDILEMEITNDIIIISKKKQEMRFKPFGQ